jgi:hypothetical protein
MTRLNIFSPPPPARLRPDTLKDFDNGLLEIEVDGRVMRGIRSRQRVLKAFIDLAGRFRRLPTSKEIGRQSKSSCRTIFHHFYTLDHLAKTAVLALLSPMPRELTCTVDGPSRADRISSLVKMRAKQCEQLRPVWWLVSAAVQEHEECRSQFAAWTCLERDYVTSLLKPEIHLLSAAAREDLLLRLDLLLSAASWQTLRDNHQLSIESASAFWLRSLEGLLSSQPD